jgi:spore coat polysaccharide biosynthesis protein SpsF
MRIGAVVMARMGSTRLPGKVLKDVAGKPLLGYLIDRLRRARRLDTVILATSDSAADNPIAAYGASLRVPVFRGSESDTVDRLLRAAEANSVELVIRVTGDCPLIDPSTVDQVAEKLIHGNYDYVSTDLTLQYPNGMGCEGFTRLAIARLHEASRGLDGDECWKLLRDPAMDFRSAQIAASPLGDLSRYRLTVDTAEDFELVSRIIRTLVPEKSEFSLEDIVALLRKNPSWTDINAHVLQRTGPHRRIA